MDIDGHRSLKLKEKDLYGEEVPVNNASNSMTPSYNVAVAEVQFYLSSPFNFESVRPTILVGRTKLLLSSKARASFTPVNDKVKKLIGSVALAVLLTPLHVETGVEFDNSDVLVVVRAPARPDRACHQVTSVHRISSDLTQDEFFQICE